MSAFTPQQLCGQKGYRHRTFIGNWNEDVQYEEDLMREYLRRRGNGELLSQKVGGKVRAHLSPVAMQPLRPDGCVHFGDAVMLQCAATDGFLSVDTDDVLSGPPEAKFGVTTAPAQGPVLRNTWVCTKTPCADDPYWDEKGEGGVLHYGQKFKLLLNPELTGSGRPLRLFSERKTPTCFSPVSKAQEVSAAHYGTLNTLWQVLYANPDFRFEMEGQPVKANAVVVLAHCNTTELLSSEKKARSNDFGTEWEVCAQKVYAIRAKHRELPEMPCNRWAFVTGLAEEAAEEKDTDGAEATVRLVQTEEGLGFSVDGTVVADVVDGGQAQCEGLEPGAEITAVNGDAVAAAGDIESAVAAVPHGGAVVLSVRRI